MAGNLSLTLVSLLEKVVLSRTVIDTDASTLVPAVVTPSVDARSFIETTRYAVTTSILLRGAPPVSEDALGQPIATTLVVPMSEKRWPVTLELHGDERMHDATVVTIHGKIEELYANHTLPDGRSLTDIASSLGVLCLPRDRHHVLEPRMIPLVDQLLEGVEPVIESLAIAARAPAFLTAFRDAVASGRATTSVRVKDETFALRQARTARASRLGETNTLTLADFRTAGVQGSNRHESLVALADSEAARGAFGLALASLATAMEAAAYAMEQRDGATSAGSRFNPARYFRGEGKKTPESVVAYVARTTPMSDSLFEDVSALWTSRARFVKHDSSTVTSADYERLRGAFSDALVWMGFRAIDFSRQPTSRSSRRVRLR